MANTSDPDSVFDRVRDRVAAALAPTQDDSASPQARDERPTVVGREEYREEVDAEQVETFVTEYYRNPLVRVPVQNFAADVTEPGVSVGVSLPDGDADVPTVEYDGRDQPLDEALSAWASNSFIDGFKFDGDFADLLEEVVKDRRGRRGTAIVEHAYDDPRERERLLGLKPLKTETVTAYTREGKAIVLRPDDDPGSFDTVAVRDYGDAVRDEAPTTPAGKTAAIAQFDDVFGAEEREEIPFALDDVTISPHDADTGELFGRPDSAPVIERARALRKKLRYVDQSVVNTAFGNIIATVETQDEEVVKNVRDNLDVNVKDRGEDVDPETVSATNAPVDVTEVEGQVPDVVDVVQQEIEYILSAMPTPLYRVGFAGDINRDVTAEQGEDYRDAVKRERRRLEADFGDILERKARELLHGDAHADEPVKANVELRIRPETSESPLRDEEFDAAEFSELMSALSTAAGPKGGATEILPEDVIIETLLDMDAEAIQEAAPGDGQAPPITPPGESEPAVMEAFAEFTDADLPALLADEDGPFAEIPVLPDDLETLTRGWLIRWAEWVAAGRPEIDENERLVPTPRHAELDFNPALHPRDPDTGQFVERPFDLPDGAPDFGDFSTKETLEYLDENGAAVDAVLDPDTDVTVDGVPEGATSLDEIPDDPEEADPDPADGADGDDGADTGPAQVTSTVEGFDPADLASGLYDFNDLYMEYNFTSLRIGPVGETTKQRSRDALEAMLGSARDEEVAATMGERLGYIADQVDRAFAAATFKGSGIQQPGDEDAAITALSENESVSTINHEFGHVLAQTFGYGGVETSAASDMNYFPDMETNLDRVEYAVGKSKGTMPNDLDEMMSRVREDVDAGADGSEAEVLEAMERVQSIDDPEGRMEEYVKAANRAFHRQHVAYEEGGMFEAGKYIIKSKYSSTNAHEVLSRTNEVLQSGRGSQRETLAIRNLVNGHPDLVGSYLALFEPSDEVKEFLADEMEVEV